MRPNGIEKPVFGYTGGGLRYYVYKRGDSYLHVAYRNNKGKLEPVGEFVSQSPIRLRAGLKRKRGE